MQEPVTALSLSSNHQRKPLPERIYHAGSGLGGIENHPIIEVSSLTRQKRSIATILCCNRAPDRITK
jgi:hypothetical protein